MMILSPGVRTLAWLMQLDQGRRAVAGDDLAWLLHGPTADTVVAAAPAQAAPDEAPTWPLAAE